MALRSSLRRLRASAAAPKRVRGFRSTPAALAPVPKKSVTDLADSELAGKKVLIRCDLNVPLDASGAITDDTRIRASVPTIEYLLSKGARVGVASHLGRPKSGPEAKFSLAPAAARLGEILGQECKLAPDCVGDDVQAMADGLGDGGLFVLENTRFYPQETKNEPEFVKQLASPFDLYVNDAFGTAHRAHASTEGVTNHLSPAVAGLLLQKELDYLIGAVEVPATPFVAIVGGAKVSSKITVIESLLAKCDAVVIGGGMVFTFLKAQGYGVGASLIEDDYVDTAKRTLELAEKAGVRIVLPSDIVVADRFAEDAEHKVVPASEIPDGWLGLDNGPDATAEIQELIKTSKTVVWNGPMGVFEMANFARGTYAVAETLAEATEKSGTISIIGGGDSVAAVEKSGLAPKMSHISTGGGASLELLEGKTLPGVAALDDK